MIHSCAEMSIDLELCVTNIIPDHLVTRMTECSSWQEVSSITISPDTLETRTRAEMRRDVVMMTGRS